MNAALEYLKSKEWSMGNGQCPDCYGSRPRMGWWTETIGHKPNCKLAKAIVTAGGRAEAERANHSKARIAHKAFFMPIVNCIDKALKKEGLS